MPETIRGAQWFGLSGLNVLTEYADIHSAAAADISAESANISDHIEGTVDHNLIPITPIDAVPHIVAAAD